MTRSFEIYQRALRSLTESFNESERYLNSRKSISRRFTFYQSLLKQIDEHRTFETQLKICKEKFNDFNRLAEELIHILAQVDSIPVRNSLISAQTRWQRIVTHATERSDALKKVSEEMKMVNFLFCFSLNSISFHIVRFDFAR